MKNPLRIRAFLGPVALVFASAATLLTGCSGFTSSPSTTGVTGSLHLTGTVHGAEEPVNGAKVFLYYVGFTNGGASQSLLTTTGADVTTDANGNFSITGDYTCPSFTVAPSTYLLATGGNPGLAGGTNNTAIALIAALGPCDSAHLNSSTKITINELTTVAAVTALQQFMVDATHIGAYTTSSQDGYSQVLNTQNAMLVAHNLVDEESGIAAVTPGTSSGVSPQAKVNTLGNILVSCVNSASAASPSCAALFAAATPTGGTAPTNTAVAMLNIAKNPGTNVTTLFGLAAATAPFQPALSSPPNDFALSITYNGGGLAAPGPIAVDNAGDVFVANCPSCNSVTGTDSVVGFEPNGTILTTATTYQTNVHKPVAIAMDRYNCLWVAEASNGTLGNQVTRIDTTKGGAICDGGATNPAPPSFPQALTGTPGGMALVENGPAAAYITDAANARLQLINYDGTNLGGVNLPAISNPSAISEDGLQNLYIVGTASNQILKYSNFYTISFNPAPNTTGTLNTISGTSSGVSAPVSVALDENDHLWTYDSGTKAVSELRAFDGTAKSGTGGYTGHTNSVAQLILDGAASPWMGNCRASCASSGSTSADNIVHLTTAGASALSSDGLQDSHLSKPTYSAIDMSGNLWVSNTAGGSVTEFVGVANPVVTEQETASSKNVLGVAGKQYLLNPSFELGDSSNDSNPPDWTFATQNGNASTVAKTDTGGFSGQQKLTFYDGAMEALDVTETQTITGLPTGTYLFSCYAAGYPGGGEQTSITALTSGTTYSSLGYTGSGSASTSIIDYNFAPLSVLVPVTSGTMVVTIHDADSYANGGDYEGFDACSVTLE